MVLFCLGAFVEFIMSLTTVTGPLFDLYYVLIGPEVGLLGAGVLYLVRPRVGRFLLSSVAVLSAVLLVAVLVWPVNLSGLATTFPATTYQQEFQSSVVNGISDAVSTFNQVPRGITMILNSIGAILVIGGGIYSWIVDRRRRYALIITLGALMNAAGGILLGILNYPDVFFYFEFLGILLLFLGFVQSNRFVAGVDATVATKDSREAGTVTPSVP